MIYFYEFFKLGHSIAQAARNINQDFDEVSFNERTIHCWFSEFSSEDTMLKNLTHKGLLISNEYKDLKKTLIKLQFSLQVEQNKSSRFNK